MRTNCAIPRTVHCTSFTKTAASIVAIGCLGINGHLFARVSECSKCQRFYTRHARVFL